MCHQESFQALGKVTPQRALSPWCFLPWSRPSALLCRLSYFTLLAHTSEFTSERFKLRGDWGIDEKASTCIYYRPCSIRDLFSCLFQPAQPLQLWTQHGTQTESRSSRCESSLELVRGFGLYMSGPSITTTGTPLSLGVNASSWGRRGPLSSQERACMVSASVSISVS